MNEAAGKEGMLLPKGRASSVARRVFWGAAASLLLVANGWSYTGTATATATVQPAGPRAGANGTNFVNFEGDGNGSNASFGVLDFAAGTFSLGVTVTGISNLTVTLVESDLSFTKPGAINFYLSQDTTTATSTLKFDSTLPMPSEGVGAQLGPLTLLGTGAFTTTGATNTGKVDVYTLTLPSSAQSYFLGQINSSAALRLVVTPATSAGAATFFGATTTTVTNRPQLSFDATLNQPTLTWKGGPGTWNPPGTAADTSWSGGPWQSDRTAIFNATGGSVDLASSITAVGMTFDSDGYTISGAAGRSLTLTGGIVQVTNPGQTATVSAVVAGSVGLIKNGSGTLVLSGNNTYTGATRINDGTLSVGSDANLGAAANGVVLNNGTLRTSAELTLGSDRTLSGSGTLDNSGGGLTVAGPVTASALNIVGGTTTLNNSTTLGSASVAGGSTLAINGNVSSGARIALTGDGRVVLGADNSGYGAGFSTARGSGAVGPTVVLTSGGSLGTGALFFNAGALQATGDIAVTAQISAGNNVTFGGTTPGTNGAFEFNTFTLFGPDKKILTFNVPTTISGTFSGNALATANNSFNKAGTALVILSSPTNSYNGGTNVTGGKLEVAGSGTLGSGLATDGKPVTVTAMALAHVTLQIDNNQAINDFADVILTSNGTFRGQLDLEFAATAANEVINSLLIDGAPVAPGSYPGGVLNLLYPNIILGTGGLTINNLAAVPEPSTWALLAFGTALLAGRKIRRRA